MTSASPRTKDWTPFLWAGCSVSSWVRLLAENRFAVHRERWRVALLASAASVVNSALGLAQRAALGRRIAGTPIAHPPVFILGHWRTGTTLLHELLGCDPRHAFPTT